MTTEPTQYNYKDGRIWIQPRKFESYSLLLPYGITDIVDPTGSLNPLREPSPSKRRESVIVDTIRDEPGLVTFNIETHLKKTFNYMLGLRTRKVNYQVHLGHCGRPDNYLASTVAFHLPRSSRGDLQIDRGALINGTDGVIKLSAPWSAEALNVIDFEAEFVSARTIAESEDLAFAAFIVDDCGNSAYEPGDYGYIGGNYSLYGAVVWRTTDKGGTFTNVGDHPFGATENISDGIVIGEPYRHRLIVARGTSDVANPAEIAYADVTEDQTVSFVNVDVGAVDGAVVTKLLVLDWTNILAATDDGLIYKSRNGGATWSIVKASGSAVADMAGLGRTGKVVAVGASNAVYLSEDFGESWDTLTGITGTFTACELTMDGTIFVGASTGAMYGTYDDGVNWTTLSAQGTTPTAINDIAAYDDDNIWVAVETADGGRVVRSVDGGAGFYLWHLNMPSNTGINSLYLVDGNFVWAVGDDGFVTYTKTSVIGI